MNITIDQAQGRVPVTVLGVHGNLDGSNFQVLIATAKEIYAAGARNVLVDMSDMPFMSSAGLVALHQISVLLRGEQPPDPDSGWEAIHAIDRALDRDRDTGPQRHVKLLSPQPQADRVLDKSGMKPFFEVHADRETAIASF